MVGESEAERDLRTLVAARIAAKKPQIENSLHQIAAGNPLGAEPDLATRAPARLSRVTGLSRKESIAFAATIKRQRDAIDEGLDEDGAEAAWGPTIDFVGIEFLERARLAANAVGRIRIMGGLAIGTGFLVAPGLLLTNNHVIRDPDTAAAMEVEFDYELDRTGTPRAITSFGFDPSACFVTHPIHELDYTLIALGPRRIGGKDLESFAFIPLSDASDKHMLGELANIIQHPLRQPKQIVVRENPLVARDETLKVLHYLADTEPGSSGSPVFNNQWEAIALHHWGGPHLEIKGVTGKPLRRDINEGIRISAIVTSLRTRHLEGRHRTAVAEAITLWDLVDRQGPMQAESAHQDSGAAATAGARVHADGTVSWTFPIEISVRAPLLEPQAPALPQAAPALPVAPEPAAEPAPAPLPAGAAPALPGAPEAADTDFKDRGGYESGFIPGFHVPLPGYAGLRDHLAKNRVALPGEDPYELKYHHFSILMRKDRRLAALTAVNIDGSRMVQIVRDGSKPPKVDPTVADMDLTPARPRAGGSEAFEETWEDMERAEAADAFGPDPRILASEQIARDFYDDQDVPGFSKPKYPGRDASPAAKKDYHRLMSNRTARMWQKGHIIMRSDPAWGTIPEAQAGEHDTFYYTNAAPQLGYFNQGSPEDSPGAKGKLRWRVVETYVLRNALTMKSRVSVFAGPIFDDIASAHDGLDAYDPPSPRTGVKIPMRFFKIAVWAEDGALRAVALKADQRPVLDRLTQGVPEAAEAYGDPDELAIASEFLTTVAEIEALTGLDFGAEVRTADIRAGAESDEPALETADRLVRPETRPAVQSKPVPRPARKAVPAPRRRKRANSDNA